MTSDCTVGGLCEIFMRDDQCGYMKFWHSGGALPVGPGVAFHLAQPLHPVCRSDTCFS